MVRKGSRVQIPKTAPGNYCKHMAESYIIGGEGPIDFHIHPDYWAPHFAGDYMNGGESQDSATARIHTPLSGEVTAAQRVMQSYLKRKGSSLPVTSFNTGDEFDVNGFEPGTLLGVDAEFLYAPIDMEASPDDFQGVQPPVRTPRFWPGAQITFERDQSWTYIGFAIGATVVRGTGSDGRRLVGLHFGASAHDLLVPGSNDGYVYYPAASTMGDVSHTIPVDNKERDYGIQTLSRINRIDVLVLGKAETKRRPSLADAWRARRAAAQSA